MSIDYPTAMSYNAREIQEGDFTQEMLVRIVEEWQAGHPPLAVDGKCGPKTQASITEHLPVPEPKPLPWKPWDGPLTEQPKNRAQVYEMFGNPGTTRVSSVWYVENIVEVYGANALPGVPGKWYVKIQKDVEPYAREGLRRVSLSSPYKIERCGGFVFRHSQYNDSLPLSYHAFGLALDFDSYKNGARRFEPGTNPEPWSPEWLAIWPHGVDEQFVLAMESCGWHWGGRWTRPSRIDGKIFIDPMHFYWVGGAVV
jgi:hypothetical protein